MPPILPASPPLIHWSAEPLTNIQSKAQFPAPNRKPRGLWFSVGDGEDGWRAWCEGESFALDCLAHATALTLKADLLVLRNAGDIRAFTKDYKRGSWKIDWEAVAKEYPGIMIAPYCWECRLAPDTDWYYSWDVASGAIWDARAIEGLRPWEGKQELKEEPECQSLGAASDAIWDGNEWRDIQEGGQEQ